MKGSEHDVADHHGQVGAAALDARSSDRARDRMLGLPLHVGIAIGARSDVAIEAAGIVLASDYPRGVLSVLRLSRAGYRKMLQNLGWAVGYNAVALPIAAWFAAPIGLTIPPGLAAILMSFSTAVAVLNAQLLRGLDLRPAATVA